MKGKDAKSGDYSADDDHVYYAGRRIVGADPGSFKVTGKGFGVDKYGGIKRDFREFLI